MRLYSRLTIEEREEISLYRVSNISIRQIACLLGRSPSTIQRELKRNKPHAISYRAIRAQYYALKRGHSRRRPRKIESNPLLKEIVHDRVSKHWSPQQISEYLKQEYANLKDMNVSHESIYTYIYVLPRGSLKKALIMHLRQKHHIRRPRNKIRLNTRAIPDLISIEERPREVENRIIPGHWEGDLMMGADNQSALGTLVERTTRFTVLVPIRGRDALSVQEAFARQVKKLPEQLRLSLTYDQGAEMREHRLFTRDTQMKVFFAHPHCPWERGTNENTNGLLRDFFPKGCNFTKLTINRIKHVQALFNERPRKVINWKSPAEAFKEVLNSVALET